MVVVHTPLSHTLSVYLSRMGLWCGEEAVWKFLARERKTYYFPVDLHVTRLLNFKFGGIFHKNFGGISREILEGLSFRSSFGWGLPSYLFTFRKLSCVTFRAGRIE